MDGPTAALQRPYHSMPRHIHPQPQPPHAFQQASVHHPHSALGPQLDSELQSLDHADAHAYSPQFHTQFDETPSRQVLHSTNAFDQRPPQPQSQAQPRFTEIRGDALHTPRSQQNNALQHQVGQFGILTPHPALPSQPHLPHGLQHEEDLFPSPDQNGGKEGGHFSNMKFVPNPPNLDEWRTRLFNVDDIITLTEDEFQTYFPHVDNIYSHRSTQRYKRKPFVSHYWDCRLKGRPPGTAKSEDPNKKKRKRQARERDLCDVKIKITEYFTGAMINQEFAASAVDVPGQNNFYAPGQPGGDLMLANQQAQHYGNLPPNHPSAVGQKYYTIQRVNGNGGNGKGDGIAGPHKHSLEESDRVKKNSIQRHFLKDEKEKRKSQKTYHKKATGSALATAKKHSKEHDLKLFGSCFCPFVQRVWISLEVKGINYQYVEVDPYKKPESLLEINPRGLVPALRHGDWGIGESTVLMEYLEDLNMGAPLLPPNDPKGRAHCRLWTDHINRHIVPAFYHYLQAQKESDQISNAKELKDQISTIVDAADATGPFFLGANISFVDIQFAPWMIRMNRVLKPYRGWPEPEEGSRWAQWVEAIESNEHVKATTSTDDLYLDSYERYAENRPDTSQLAKAVNSGKGLP